MSEQATTIEESGLMQKLFTIEGIMMLSLATFIDVGEAFLELLPPAGTILSIMLDIFAIIFIGIFWMHFFRAKKITVSGKTAAGIKKAVKLAKKYKWLKPACIIFEMIPIVSSIAPLWVGVVLLELASGDD
jgi:hypothetical protein